MLKRICCFAVGPFMVLGRTQPQKLAIEARLAFCKFMVKPSTLLVLDEPTNHLDIPSKEMLEEAITEYKGTVITVSHDRYFIKQIVNRVLEVKDGSLQDYAGDYNTGSEIDCGFQSVVTRHMPYVLSSNTRVNHAPPIANAIQMIEFDILNPVVLWQFTSFTVVYYLEKNIEARERELEREADVDEKSPKAKAKSKMSKLDCSAAAAAENRGRGEGRKTREENVKREAQSRKIEEKDFWVYSKSYGIKWCSYVPHGTYG
ncbi:hypothetical protein TEA_021990 [Camellia sinensis var. sinensis]|uniref:ABC transporter domain-containing protein n=1 Tax=Camellia sinensis var. sinensis TaxID=542762 RepID=A0A4S4DJ74_CAMSN|nr:hypothetical protein TEA_021990 [Camellia sinensis var. sinensis]